jgi:hypothetical protein
MGFFGTEFIDVQRELGGGGFGAEVALRWEDLAAWSRENPNGLTFYFREGRYVLRRWRNSYLFWDGDFVFPVRSVLWFERGATLVYEEARLVVRGLIQAPLSQIFRREEGIDTPIGQAGPLSRGHVLIEADLPSLHPEWWGAASDPTVPDDLALRDTIESATARRAPLASTLTLNRDNGRYELRRVEGPKRPPIPVVFSQEYRVVAPVVVGSPVQLSEDQTRLLQPGSEVLLEYGVKGRVIAVLRGVRRGTTTPQAGLKFVGPATADKGTAVLHLKSCFGATVDDLRIDASGAVDLGVLLESSGDVAQIHSVAFRRCHVRNARSAQIQIGPPANVGALRVPLTVTDDRQLGGDGVGRFPTIKVPVTFVDPAAPPELQGRVWVPDNGLDTVGLVIDQCLIECRIQRVTDMNLAAAPVGIQLRAQNGVANLISNCRFRGDATAFVDARATLALIENCDFENGYYTPPTPGLAARASAASFQFGVPERGAYVRPTPRYLQVSIDGQQVPYYVAAESTTANLGFEEPSGHDVYLGAEPRRAHPFWERPIAAAAARGQALEGPDRERLQEGGVDGNVAMYGCTSRSAMMFGTVRPGPLEGKRPERATMMLGCVHQPGWLFPPPVSSVQWGRAGVSPYRALPAGVSPGYSGDPCFCVVGSYLEAGVEVFQGAAQCAVAAFNTRQQRLASPVVSQARPGVRARTFIFELIFALLALLTVGCGQSASGAASDGSAATDASSLTMDVASTDRDVLRQDIYAVLPGDVNLFPYDIHGTIPFNSYGPPRQHRRDCPIVEEGDPTIPPPRLVSPLTNLRMTSQRPTLFWELTAGLTGAQIEICRDPCCRTVLQTLNAEGTSVRPPTALAAGVVFWRARGRVGSRVGRDTSFTWEFGVPHRDSTIDTFKGPVHDFNGDGFDDVVAWVYPNVRVYWGGEGGLIATRFADYRAPAEESQTNITLNVADLNSDGLSDVVIGASADPQGEYPNDYHYRTIRVLYGSREGLASEGIAHIVGNLTSVMDLNGDGFVDLMGRAPSGPQGTRRNVMILYGGSNWAEYGRRVISDPSASEPTVYFGSCESPGDFDADGYGDMFVGDISYGRGRGRLYYYPGSAGAVGQTPFRFFDPPSQIEFRAEWGTASGIGDVDGDRLADLMVLSNDTQQVIMLGRRSLESVTQMVIRSSYPTSVGGSATGPSSDLNGDGTQDVYLGCSVCLDRRRPDLSAGRIVVLTDVPSGVPRVLWEVEPPIAEDAQFGRYFGQPALAIDVDGDGFDDLVTRDPERTSLPSRPARGYIFVVFGGMTFGERRQRVNGRLPNDTSPYGGIGTIASVGEWIAREGRTWEPMA